MSDERAKGGGGFPSTHLSALRGLHSPEPAVRERSLHLLALSYWRPVYRHVRLRWHKPAEQSRDLCQEFFARAIEKRTFDDFDPAKGRFRTFLRTCVDRFVVNEDKAMRRIKRGGNQIAVPLDMNVLEAEIANARAYTADQAEEQFEREWVRTLLDASIDALRASLETRNKRIYYEVFELYVLADREPQPSYADIAGELGITVTDVTNWLAFARRELRRIVMDRLRAITATEEELLDETRVVLGA